MELVLHKLTFSIFKSINSQSLFIPHSKSTVPPLQTSTIELYIHGSMHHDSILIKSNKMQQYAGIYLLQICSTSSGLHETVTAASGTGHIT